MVLSKREKIIAATFGGVLLIFAADRYLFTPHFDERARVSNETELVDSELEKGDRLLANRAKVKEAWSKLQAAGLKSDPAAAESLSLNSLRDWAQSSRVSLVTLKTDRAIQTGDFQQIRLQVSGTGNTSGMAQFLQYIETSKVPLSIAEFRANSRKEGSDDLAFTMTVSTLAFSPAPPTKTPKARAAAKGQL